MSVYSINIISDEGGVDEITEEIQNRFMNRDKSSSKRINGILKLEESPETFQKIAKPNTDIKPNDKKRKSTFSKLESTNTTKNKAFTDGIKVYYDKVDELESTLNNLIIDGTEFDDAFDKLIEKKLITVDNVLDKNPKENINDKSNDNTNDVTNS